jgi:arginine exporter protein ArgO
MHGFLGGILAGYGIAIPIGAVSVLIMTIAMRSGFRTVNPLTVVYFTALVLGGDTGASPTPTDRVLFVPGAALASLSWQTLLAGLGSILGARLPLSFRRMVTILGNVIVTASRPAGSCGSSPSRTASPSFQSRALAGSSAGVPS